MGFFSRKKPKIKVQSSKKDGFSGWIKCSGCNEMVHAEQLQNNLNCCPKCNYHYRISVKQRLDLLIDENSFSELFSEIQSIDPLGFEDQIKYASRLERAKKKSNRDEAILTGTCRLGKMPITIGILDFSFMGGSMGSVVGERIACLIEYAIDKNMPVLLICASGGARMQESVLSLMQMAKTSAALTKLSIQKLPYICVLTNPTTGGVTASFASLGDIIIAEPKALIGFAGPKVVEQTIRHSLPDGAQKSEFLLENGMIDCIVDRKDLKDRLIFFFDFLSNNNREFIAKKSQIDDKLPQKLKEILKKAKYGIQTNT
jgi:acetyl-CoA carboxylase carboxyl transferase subunit beta